MKSTPRFKPLVKDRIVPTKIIRMVTVKKYLLFLTNSNFGYGVHLMRISDGTVYTGYYQANGWKLYSVTPTIMS